MQRSHSRLIGVFGILTNSNDVIVCSQKGALIKHQDVTVVALSPAPLEFRLHPLMESK